jgi:hypothetical protein
MLLDVVTEQFLDQRRERSVIRLGRSNMPGLICAPTLRTISTLSSVAPLV